MKYLFKLILGANLISIYQLAKLNFKGFVIAARNSFFAGKSYVPLPEIELKEILGTEKIKLTLDIDIMEDGALPIEQCVVLLAILAIEKPKVILEIGTFMGSTTKKMSENLPDAIIHTVDLPIDFSACNDPNTEIPKDDFHLISKRDVGREFRNTEFANRIYQHFVDTAKWDFKEVGNPSFFFIDGSHTYEYCKNDSEKCFQIAASSSTFVWHDCDSIHPGVVKFLKECRKKGLDVKRISGTPLAYLKAE